MIPWIMKVLSKLELGGKGPCPCQISEISWSQSHRWLVKTNTPRENKAKLKEKKIELPEWRQPKKQAMTPKSKKKTT
jgi:hypothetical protein